MGGGGRTLNLAREVTRHHPSLGVYTQWFLEEEGIPSVRQPPLPAPGDNLKETHKVILIKNKLYESRRTSGERKEISGSWREAEDRGVKTIKMNYTHI